MLLHPHGSRFVDTTVGAPVGAAPDATYEEVTISVPPRSAVVAFTDGLVERRGEVVDVGLARLRAAACTHDGDLDDLVSTLARELASEGHHDDTAILAIRWRA